MKIQINTTTGKSLTTEVEGKSTVGETKSTIYHILGLAPSEQNLIFSNQELEETFSLEDYGIVNGNKLHLVPILKGGGQLLIKLLTGKIVKIEIDLEKNTVLELKKAIHPKIGMSHSSQKLLHKGKELRNEKTLKDCNVSNGETLILILTLTGGYN